MRIGIGIAVRRRTLPYHHSADIIVDPHCFTLAQVSQSGRGIESSGVEWGGDGEVVRSLCWRSVVTGRSFSSSASLTFACSLS